MWVAVQGCARRSPTLSEGKSKSGHSCWSWFDQLPCWPPSPMPSDPVPPLWGPRRLHIHTQPLPPAHRTPPPRLLGSRPTLGGHAAGSRPPPSQTPWSPPAFPAGAFGPSPPLPAPLSLSGAGPAGRLASAHLVQVQFGGRGGARAHGGQGHLTAPLPTVPATGPSHGPCSQPVSHEGGHCAVRLWKPEPPPSALDAQASGVGPPHSARTSWVCVTPTRSLGAQEDKCRPEMPHEKMPRFPQPTCCKTWSVKWLRGTGRWLGLPAGTPKPPAARHGRPWAQGHRTPSASSHSTCSSPTPNRYFQTNCLWEG